MQLFLVFHYNNKSILCAYAIIAITHVGLECLEGEGLAVSGFCEM